MKNKKLKHGAISVAITAAVLVGVIIFNVVFTLLANKNLWLIDTMPNELDVISDYSKGLLSDIDPNENNFTIYFLADPDELENYELNGHSKGENSSTWGMSYIYNLARLYEKEFSYIKVKTLDLDKDADYIRENFAMTIGTSITALTVVIENLSNDGHRSYRTHSRDEFYAFGEDTMYFRGDDRFTSSILSLSGDSPIAYFIEGHGENIGPLGDDDDFGNATEFAKLFEKSGYIVKKLDLSKEDFEPENPDNSIGSAGVVVFYGPTTDLVVDKNGSVDELSKLRKYLNQKNHNLMVFMDPGTEYLPNLEEYLEDIWGVQFEDNIVVADTSDPATSSAASADGLSFYGNYELSNTSPGSALTSSLTSLSSLPNAYFSNACTIKMNNRWSDLSEGTTVMEGVTTYKLGATFKAPVLSALKYDEAFLCFDENIYNEYIEKYYDTKYAEVLELVNQTQYQKAYDKHLEEKSEEYKNEGLTDAQIADKCKEYAENYVNNMTENIMDTYIVLDTSNQSPIMTLTEGSWMYEQSESVKVYMISCGSTSFASNEALANAAYSNRDVIYSAIYLFGRNILPFDIDIIKIEDPSSLSIPDSEANEWTVVLVGVIPALFVAAGIFVLVRRRRHN